MEHVKEFFAGERAEGHKAVGDEGKAAGADAASHCASRFHFMAEEKVFI